MTEIQHTTFDTASQGKDVLGRARAGTGNTLAFLLPTEETLLANNNNTEHGRQNDACYTGTRVVLYNIVQMFLLMYHMSEVLLL